MAKKDYFLIVDTETTNDGNVFDFGAIVCDKKGNVYQEIGVVVAEFKDDELFWDGDAGFFGRSTLQARTDKYSEMIKNGSRMVASVAAINRWLEKVNAKYEPILTAYNISFDTGKCLNSGIDLAMFNKRFCLWHASFTKWATKKAYKNFIVKNHYFNKPTKFGNMTYSTNAETMARFITNNPMMEDEPHTALEDAKLYEMPILIKLVNTTAKKVYMNPESFDWRKIQVKNHFIAK